MIHIALQRHPDIDVDGTLAEIQQSAAKLSAAWSLGGVQVSAYNTRKPRGSWRVHWSEKLPSGAGGIHLDSVGKPYALVRPEEGITAATHELFEMAVDPVGTRITRVPRFPDREYLIEVCDPVERATTRSGVSDWVYPSWYGSGSLPVTSLGLHVPALQTTKGGYVSFISSGFWWQQYDGQPPESQGVDLGRAYARTRREKDRREAAL